ncbi:MAG: TraB/GumN family protein, partial [SAR324 cluster bacterium]|nr:TraB/GumN family protein [SAR324 cluster bacterium]
MTEPPARQARPDPPQLAENVRVLPQDGRTLYLLGTAHISARSVEEVRELIERVRPDSVCVELDAARHRALADREAWREMDVVQVVRRRRAMMLLAHLILAAFQRRLGRQLGVRPGAEMLEAAQCAQAVGAELVLADREIQVTFRRMWGALTWLDKIKLISQLMLTLLMNPKISEEEIEALKEKDLLGQVMENFARAFPRAHAPLIA